MPAYGRGGAGNIEAATTPAVITGAATTNPRPTTSTSTTNNTTTHDVEKQAAGNADAAEKALQNTESYLEARTHLASYAGTPHDSLHNQQYAHMGRGGAGNYYSPWELQMRGEFSGAGTSHVLGDGTPQPKSQETESQKNDEKTEEKKVVVAEGYRGRGGAGNFSYGVSESEERATRKRLEEEERKRQGVKQNVEKVVEEGLARPEKAKLPVGNGEDVV